jgi:restriction system protein
MGDCSALQTRGDFREQYVRSYPDDTNKWRIGLQSGQIYRFAREIRTGDLVLTPDSPRREILIGRVAGDYSWAPGLVSDEDESYPHLRRVEWLRTVSRDDMVESLRAATGSATTVSSLEGYEEEVVRLLEGRPPDEGTQDQVPFDQETQAKADELISDMLAGIDPFDFERLVAAVMRAMGFRAALTQSGADGGVDIIAHPDALGFAEPRIKVQVKHTKGSIGAPEVRSFRSAVRPHEKGLFVATGGFTSEALKEPETAGAPLTLVDRDRFIDLLTEYYEALEPEYQAMVPLKKVYIPAPKR